MEEFDERSTNGEDNDNDDDDNYIETWYKKVLEELSINDPNLTSLNLCEDYQVNDLLYLLERKELCVKAGNLIGGNTYLSSLYINNGSDDYGENDEKYQRIMNEHSENYNEFLRGVANNRSITKLDLGYLPDNSDAVEILGPLFKNSALTAISFENCTGVQTIHLASFLSRRIVQGTLKHLCLEGTRGEGPMNDYTAKLIKVLNKSHSLETLTLNWTTINERSSRRISNMLRNPSCTLRELTLEYNLFNNESLSVFANGLLENSTLERLNLKGSENVSAEGWVNFFGILRPTKLRSLSNLCLDNLKGSELLSNEGLTNFYNSLQPSKMGALHTIHLGSNSINDEGVAIFVEVFANNNTLEELDLSQNNSITTVGWQTLASLFFNTKSAIRSIDISNENDSFDDGAAIAWANALSISKNAKLKILQFIPLAITAGGWSALENLVCNKTSVDSMYDSNHILHLKWPKYVNGDVLDLGLPSILIYEREMFVLCDQVPRGMKLYQEFQQNCIILDAFGSLDRSTTTHDVALHKIIRFYFMRGEANIKEILDMELNVMAHAIARIGSAAGGDYGGRVLLYQLIRSVPSLLEE
jgi:hypothetical protein